MTNTDLKIQVQKASQLSAAKTLNFIQKQKNAKLIILHSSLKDDKKLEQYIKELNKRNETPLIGLKVSGTYTKGNYYEDSAVIGVLCGNMEVQVHQTKINYENPDETAEAINQNIGKLVTTTLLVYTSVYMYNLIKIDNILRKINEKHPSNKIGGANSIPEPRIFTNSGIFKDSIASAVIRNIKSTQSLETGLDFKTDSREYIITKSDTEHIYEIDNQNAVDVYCQITSARPWFIKMFVKLVEKVDISKIAGKMANANQILYNSIKKTLGGGLGRKIRTGTVCPLSPMILDDEKKIFTAEAYIPIGTKLKWLFFTKDSILNAYDKIVEKTKNAKVVIGHSCEFRRFLYNFDEIESTKRIKIKNPYMISYAYGEIGIPHLYKKEDSLVHIWTVKTLAMS